MASETPTPDRGTDWLVPGLERLGRRVLYLVLPLLVLGTLMAGWQSAPLHSHEAGEPLAARFLVVPPDATDDPGEWMARLADQPSRLTMTLPAGNVWLLADLPTENGHDGSHAGRGLLLRGNNAITAACWLPQASHDTATATVQRPLSLQAGLAGLRASLPNPPHADQVLCHLDLAVAGTLVAERWDIERLFDTEAHTARALGLTQGGLLALVLFVGIIGMTLHDWPYLVLAGWLIGTLRMGAWALQWDHQWLGLLISAADLGWVRSLTLVSYFFLSSHLFILLFRDSLEAATVARLKWTSNGASLVLLTTLLTLPDHLFQAQIFFTAWLGTGLVAVILTHALFRSTTRNRFWHTVGVWVALAILLLGMILIGLGHRDAIDPLAGSTGLLMAGLLMTLATADQQRDARQNRLRRHNDLIARDTLTPLGLFTLGATRHFEHMNPVAREILQVGDRVEPLTLAWQDFFPEVDWLAVALATEQGRDTEVTHLPASARETPRRFLLRATMAGSRIEGSLQDISARSATIRKLRMMADNDPLTDTFSRRGIEALTRTSIEQLKADGTPTAMAFLDLDHVQRINDLFGHSAGDALLQMVCERVRYSLSDQPLGRIGNDEFIILFPGMRASDAQQIAQDILDSLNSAPLHVGERSFRLKSAMGLIDINADMRPKDAVAAAGRACREARRLHQDIVLYERNADELHDHIDEQHLFEQLERGAPPEDLYLMMQPIMSLRHPLLSLNVETLLRAKRIDGELLDTGRFIQAAEDNGIISAIDQWVFSTTLEWMGKHHLKLRHTRQINLNLSGVSLNDDRFIDTLFDILNRQPQFTRNLCVEITEGVALQDLDRTRQFMRRLQRMGARVALDDFGAGYTSFSYLKELPADLIKIDGVLIRDMLASEPNVAIVTSIVKLAHNLGMECIAEWVEDLPTLRLLTDIGIDYVQGNAICPPRPLSDILAHDTILPLIQDPAILAYIRQLGQRP